MICINTCAQVALDMGGGLEPGLGLFRYTSSTLLELLNMKLYKYRRIFFFQRWSHY